MGGVPVELLRDAVNALATRDDVAPAFAALAPAVEFSRRYPIQLSGHAAFLNPLLDLGRDDPDALQRLLSLVESKRAAAGLAPLVPEKDSAFDRTEYQRQFMDQKRQRTRRAVDIENMRRPERDQLRGTARMDFQDLVAAKWKKELDEIEARAREAAPDGRLSRETWTSMRQKFWSGIDKRLDEEEAVVRRSRLL